MWINRAFFSERRPLRNAESVLLVHDYKPQPFNFNGLLNQRVSAYQHIDFAIRGGGADIALFSGGHTPRQQTYL